MHSQYKDITAQLQAIIDTAIDGIIVIDEKAIIEEINQSALRLFHYEKEEVVGKNVNILMPSPERENHDGYIRNYQTSRQPKIIGIGREVNGLKKDGTVFPFRLAVSEVKMNQRTVYTGIIHDLTDVKAAESDRNQLLEELEQRVIDRTNELENVVNRLISTNRALENEIQERKRAETKLKNQEQLLKVSLQKEKELNELKSRFLSMASHEFRTPLSTILSSISLIERYQNTEQQEKRKRHIDRIKSSINNLTGILSDFLSLDKLDTGNEKIDPIAIDIHTLIEDAISDVSGLFKTGQSIHLESSGQKQVVRSDPRIIKNILFNLFVNATKYSDNGSIITCHVEYKEKFTSIHVIDKGIGIPKNEQKHIMDRFYRASNVSNIKGTGLGLNIVQKYLELIKGSMNFSSIQGKGSTFTIHIPNQRSD